MIWLIYLAGVLANVQTLLVISGVISALMVIGTTVCSLGEYSELPEKIVSYLAMILGVFMLASIIPSSTTIYLMAGVHVIETTDLTPELDKIRELVNIKLDQLIKE